MKKIFILFIILMGVIFISVILLVNLGDKKEEKPIIKEQIEESETNIQEKISEEDNMILSPNEPLIN